MGRVRDLEDERFMTGLSRASFGLILIGSATVKRIGATVDVCAPY